MLDPIHFERYRQTEIPSYVPEEILADIFRIFTNIQKILTNPIIGIEIFGMLRTELNDLKGRLENTRVYTDKERQIKIEITEQLNRLQNYADMLQLEIDKLKAEFVSKKSVANNAKELPKKNLNRITYNRVIDSDVFRTIIPRFLQIRDWQRASGVCKAWKNTFYKTPLKYKLMFLSSANNAVMRLPSPAPYLGEFNRARKEALAAWKPFTENSKLQTVPKRLAEIVAARLSQDQKKNFTI
jgi:hypothetical protein